MGGELLLNFGTKFHRYPASFITPCRHNLLFNKKIITMIIVFLTLCIDLLSSKTNKTMIKFLTQYLQGLGQKESLHVYGKI